MEKEEEVKNPEQYAEREVNRKLGKAIADRKYRIKKLQAEIKKIEKEIEKIKKGELVPDEDSSSSCLPIQKRITPSLFQQYPYNSSISVSSTGTGVRKI